MNTRWMKIGKYLMLQIKRLFRFLPTTFAVTMILCGATALVGVGIVSEKMSGEEQKTIEVAIVGDITDSYLGFGITALKQLDPSRFAIEIHDMNEKEARQKMMERELTTYFVVPDGFVDSVVNGANDTIDYYVRSGQAGLSSMLMVEFAEIVSDYIVISQSAIYGMQDFCREHELYDIFWEATDELNLQYINFILSRTDISEVELLGVSNQLSTQGYYICGLTILFVMIWGVNGCSFFVKCDRALERLLAATGQGAFGQVLCEYVAHLLFVSVNFLGIAVIIGILCEFVAVSTKEWSQIDFGQVMTFAVQLLPAIAMLASLAFLGYELVSNIISGMLLQFMGAFVLGYLCGCFYPSSFFPESVQQIGAVLPTGIAMQYASQCMRFEFHIGTVFLLICYWILFLLFTAAVRHKKLAQV